MTRLILAVVTLCAGLQAPGTGKLPPPGLTVTLDGGIFKNQTVTLKALRPTYGNVVLRSTSDTRVNRLSIDSDYGHSGELGLHFDAWSRIGTTVFDRKDEDDPNRNPYMRFELKAEEWPAGKGYRFDLQHVEVIVTTLDPPGGRIEGTFAGTYELCTLPEGGGGNCTARAPLRIAGTFSVIRNRDRVID